MRTRELRAIVPDHLPESRCSQSSGRAARGLRQGRLGGWKSPTYDLLHISSATPSVTVGYDPHDASRTFGVGGGIALYGRGHPTTKGRDALNQLADRYSARIRGRHEAFSKPAITTAGRSLQDGIGAPTGASALRQSQAWPFAFLCNELDVNGVRGRRAGDTILTVLGNSADPLLLVRRLLNHTPRRELEARMVRHQRRKL
jgi:hypothetical protein